MTLLDVADLTITYKHGDRQLPAVRNVDFSLAGGEVVGVAGESGSGKSTMALSLLRLLPADAGIDGTVTFQGEELTSATWGRLRAVRWAQASVVFQGAMSALNPVRTVSEQIAEPIRIHDKLGDREIRNRVDELLDSVGIPARRRKAYPHQLSGGQRQRVMIAMALACRPSLIIADEPTTALDVMVQAQIIRLLADLVAESNIGVIMISHDLALLADTCDRLLVMYAGQIVESGPAGLVFNEPQHPYTQALSRAFPRIGDPQSRRSPASLPGEPPAIGTVTAGCAFAPRCEWVMPDCTTRDIAGWSAGESREAACLRVLPEYRPVPAATPALPSPTAGSAASERDEASGISRVPALEVQNLTVVHPGRRGSGPVRAVDGVNLTVAEGEVVALIGESGCGKSTLARALVGLVEPAAGQVLFRGEPLNYAGSAMRQYRRRAQLVLQDPAGALNPRQNVFDAVAEGPRLHGITDGLGEQVRRALSRAGLRPPEQFYTRYPHSLSGGQQQRVVIAGALALDPAVIVADEPVSSLDASARGEILRLLLDLRDDPGLSALVVSHDLGLAWNIADRVAVMYLGRVVEVGAVEDVLLHPKHPYTQALLSVLPGNFEGREPILLTGEPPDASSVPEGCRFHPRCPSLAALAPDDERRQLCRAVDLPLLAGTGTPSSLAACHLLEPEEHAAP